MIRYGEIALKGGNRPAFERQLLHQVERVLRAMPGVRAWRGEGRILVEGGDDMTAARERLARVFGVVSLSPALRVPLAWEAVEEAACRLMEEWLAMGAGAPASGAPTFKVEARRAYKAFPYDSPEINRRLGAALLNRFPVLKVDVHQPQVTVQVEVRSEGAYVFAAVLPGPGGLPVGSAGRGHLLLSGGIDSPVAGWLAMKRGVALECVHFHSPPFTSERAFDKVTDLCRILAGWGGRVVLHAVGFTEAQKAIYQRCPAELGVTVMRRVMVRLAEGIARERGGLALFTGESLGQVASQTLESIAAINQVAGLPILRPLIAWDKSEIVDLARRIGSYDTSVLPYEDCCTVFVPRHPAIRPSLQAVARAESNLDMEGLLTEARASVRVLEFRGEG